VKGEEGQEGEEEGLSHLVLNDGPHVLHAWRGHTPPASTGSVLVAMGASFGCWSNAKYGCVSRMTRSAPGRKPAQVAMGSNPSWMLMKGPLPAPYPVILRIISWASR
jgi:hypothetical protein